MATSIDPQAPVFRIIELVATPLVRGTPDMAMRALAGAHLAFSRVLKTCLYSASLGLSSSVSTGHWSPQSPSIHLKIIVLLMVRLRAFMDLLWRALIF